MPTSTQRVCPSCKDLTPASRPNCEHCGQRFRNEMAWKIPLIAFVLAIAASVIIELEPW